MKDELIGWLNKRVGILKKMVQFPCSTCLEQLALSRLVADQLGHHKIAQCAESSSGCAHEVFAPISHLHTD
jgi:hypothetical protein